MLALISQLTGTFLDKKDYQKALNMLCYLQESGISKHILLEIYKKKYLLDYKDLPSNLWQDSLLKPNTYYYHSRLQLTSQMPTFHPRSLEFTDPQYYKEMRISFTPDDFVQYFYDTLKTAPECQDFKKDQGALAHLLQKNPSVQINALKLDTLDILLFLIDYAQAHHTSSHYLSLFDIYNLFFSDTLIQLEQMKINPQKTFILRTGEIIPCGI